ncbi:hypothetical protein CSC94_07760 [Zhengella mangrovi]|uniref:Acyltransferase n=1 Tax=Zhengella mangrovi TaxID=1982044 RepID=A0A2G1QQU0_9HYPH|nr:acyltransferase family protein [Zhengella mangrovi]PHP67588.1 hypothetical protein CSC94_07760 [Zhengella mangrovi]
MARSEQTEHVAFTGYMPFVDGLRAIAVLAVVLNHSKLPGFSGGYAGVDMFFVISGFLIIGHIRSEVVRDEFSLVRFYARRTLRILPLFLLVLACTVLAAPLFLFVPDAYESFAKSAVAAPLMISNILFFLEQGYFDTAAQFKPLLHTWTLSVEEQFYLVVPVLILFLAWLGRRGVRHAGPGAALGIGVVSLVACILWTSTADRNAAFYLTPFRAWEFVAGGMIVPSAVAALSRFPRFALEVLGYAGAVLVALTVTLLSETSLWPGWLAILPVAGTVLMIAVSLADPTTGVARLLSLRPAVAIGLVSYGWYLWHWPLLAFGRMTRVAPDLFADLMLGGVLGLVLASATYILVERPVRRWRQTGVLSRKSGRIFAAGFASVFLMAGAGGGVTYLGLLANDHEIRQTYSVDGEGVLDTGCRIRTDASIPGHCLQEDYVLILGDSHADALYPAMAAIARRNGLNTVSLARGGCQLRWFAPENREAGLKNRCANLIGPLETIVSAEKKPVAVILTSLFAPGSVPDRSVLASLVRRFTGIGARVLLLGPVPRFERNALECVHTATLQGRGKDGCAISTPEMTALYGGVIDELAAVARDEADVKALDVLPAFCQADACRPDTEGVLFFRDRDHLFPSGVYHIVERYPSYFQWLFDRSASSG